MKKILFTFLFAILILFTSGLQGAEKEEVDKKAEEKTPVKKEEVDKKAGDKTPAKKEEVDKKGESKKEDKKKTEDEIGPLFEKKQRDTEKSMKKKSDYDSSDETKFPELKVYFKNGLTFRSKDKKHSLTLGGRIQHDWVWATAPKAFDAAGFSFDDGTEFRRVRLHLKGHFYENFIFKFELDWPSSAGGDVRYRDMYIGAKYKLAKLRIGHMWEPFGLEQLSSNNYLTFMERGYPFAFAPDRSAGIRLDVNPLENMGIFLGVFRNTNPQGLETADGSYAFTARAHYGLLLNKKNSKVVHLGASVTTRNNQAGNVSFSYGPENHLVPNSGTWLGVTGNNPGAGVPPIEKYHAFNVESAVVFGPLSFQAEFSAAFPEVVGTPNPDLWAVYGYISYFLTGEHRNYKAKKGAFGRVRPHKSLLEDGGFGAFELAVRFSYADMADENIPLGESTNVTVGANWYLNDYMRIQANYSVASLEDRGSAGNIGTIQIFAMRFQIGF